MFSKTRTYPHLLLLIAAINSFFSVFRGLYMGGSVISIISSLLHFALNICTIAVTVCFFLFQLGKFLTSPSLIGKFFTIMGIGHFVLAVILITDIFSVSGLSILTIAISTILYVINGVIFAAAGSSVSNDRAMPDNTKKIFYAGIVCYVVQTLINIFVISQPYTILSIFYAVSLFVGVYLTPNFLSSENPESFALNRKNNKIFFVCVAIFLVLLFAANGINNIKYEARRSSSSSSHSSSYKSSSSNPYGYTAPYEGESFSDYMKRQDPELYRDVVDRYNSLT